jgi:excisionase family DNA binding protein
MTPGELSERMFVTVPEVTEALGYDKAGRTVRAAIKSGEIPAIKHGATYRVPAGWLREAVAAGVPNPAAQPTAPDPGALADAVADRVIARLARALLATMGSGNPA